ncbi:MAG: VCBS repeat-containing protein [Planctomycetota bacterium]|nr:VCBS repeat-containing protein [Planctomycetota bacterium]
MTRALHVSVLRIWILVVVSVTHFTSCADNNESLFTECGTAAGLNVTLVCGNPGNKTTILEVNGNGAALADLDGDGDLDLILVDGSTKSRLVAGDTVSHHLLRNDGVIDGIPRFTPVENTGLVMKGWPTGICAGDVDRDGKTDLVIGGIGEDALFLNRTDADGVITFQKVPLQSRISSRAWSTSLALADGDGDGWLDLYITRYLEIDPADPPLDAVGVVPCQWKGHPVMCGPHGLPPQEDQMLFGKEGPPWFEARDGLGIHQVASSYCLGVLFADLDLDGWPDLYVANDSVANFLFHNQGNGTFDDHSALSGAATDMSGAAQAGMGVNLGDVDHDKDFDLVVTNFSDEHYTLYTNDGRLAYRDRTAAARLIPSTKSLLGWGVHLADFDSDGHLDLMTSNGHVHPQADSPGTGTSYAQPILFHAGQGDGSFTPPQWIDPTPRRGRAALRGDLDGDGDLDLVVLTLDGPPLLFLNGTNNPSLQMLVTLEDRRGLLPADAFGSTLAITARESFHLRQKLSATAFQSSSDPRLHFGGPGPVTAAQVLWAGGGVEDIAPESLSFGYHHVIQRGKGVVSSTSLMSTESWP